uniref:Ig-like domain-containing protein n=1 Tax=Myripristis murdjan TaxID=586833 RepID=A0A667X4H4_9TELE
MVVEWIKNLDSTDYYGMFDGHTNLDIETGRLEINTWARNYSGVYSVEFNGQLQSKSYKVDVIKKVPKPTVVLKPLTCPNEDTCTLICDGDTTGAEPVTYSWRTDQRDFYEESEKSVEISKDDSDVKHFFCQMKNPVSQEDSDPMENLLHPGAEKQVYSAEGGKVTLEPTVPDQLKPLTSILWKHNDNLVVEWIKNLDSTDYYGMFAGHTNLDIETGRLEINTLDGTYSGVYSVEFNGQLQSKSYKVDVIKKVPKPTVVLKPLTCPNEDTCTLSCDGDTTGAEPVTYSWRTDQRDFYEESEKSVEISKDDSDVKHFFCRIKNPVSEEDSDPMENPFHSGS